MKLNIIAPVALAALALSAMSCDPIEDNSLRDAYNSDNKPVSVEELTAALSVTQLPNVDGKVEGDQYIIINNNRKDIAGTWRFKRGSALNTYATDNDTIIVGANGDYEISYVGLSGNTRVESKPFNVTVTNVFDPYDNLLTGAKDKADKSSKKRWKYLASAKGNYMNMGAYGSWKYFDYTTGPARDDTWWAAYNDLAVIGDERMELVYDGTKMIVYTQDGKVKREGVFAYNHTPVDAGVFGEFSGTVGVMGAEYSDLPVGNGSPLWILALTQDRLILFRPSTYSGGSDWDDYGWYVYYQPE